MLVFACLAPHPPIILPDVGSPADQQKVKKTIEALEKLGSQLAKAKPDCILISSPHPDWGFNVPLYFLAKDIRGIEIKTQLTDFQSPTVHFEKGKKLIKNLDYIKRLVWIASGDMSHRLAKDGPYGLHPSGPKFDQKFIKLLKEKDIQAILNLNPRLIEEAGECGLRSFSMLLGAIKEKKINWRPKVLSYQAPFGVGYLVARLI
jgi:aromatic ring-opening dioxygenase LigB subunit